MIRVIDLFDRLISDPCRSCNSKAIHDPTGTLVELDCHAVMNCQFVVVATSMEGSIIFCGRVSINDNLEFTLNSTINCYDPCDKSFYDSCDPHLPDSYTSIF
jgi:hypothetical protein